MPLRPITPGHAGMRRTSRRAAASGRCGLSSGARLLPAAGRHHPASTWGSFDAAALFRRIDRPRRPHGNACRTGSEGAGRTVPVFRFSICRGATAFPARNPESDAGGSFEQRSGSDRSSRRDRQRSLNRQDYFPIRHPASDFDVRVRRAIPAPFLWHGFCDGVQPPAAARGDLE